MTEKKAITETDLQAVANEILNNMDHIRASGRTVSKRMNNWASDLAHPCERFLTYARLNWRDRQLPSVELEYRFEDGRDGEKKVRSMIEEAGFEVILSQKYFDWNKYQIAGRTDGFLKWDRNQAPLEIKTVAPHLFDKMTSAEEIKKSRSYWVYKAAAQLQLYMIMAGYEYGFLALKTFGKRPRIIPVMLDYDLCEELTQKAERINSNVRINSVPDRITYDSSLCDGCDFDHICQPVKVSQYPDQVDDRTIKDLLFFKKWYSLGSQWKKIAESLRKKLKGQNAIIEGVEISTSEYETTVYDYPEDVKKAYARTEIRYKVTLEVVEEEA